MDSVRFGRALGAGARSAARAMVTAADAAASPNPNKTRAAVSSAAEPAARSGEGTVAGSAVESAVQTAARASARAAVGARQARTRAATGGKRFGEAVWGPLKKTSGVLWLEMTGAFFAIFALFGAEGLWSHRIDLRKTPWNHAAHQHLLVYAGMTVLFAYFAVTSFLRARRKGR